MRCESGAGRIVTAARRRWNSLLVADQHNAAAERSTIVRHKECLRLEQPAPRRGRADWREKGGNALAYYFRIS